MATVKPQELKSLCTIKQQPEKMSSHIQLIIAMDIAGYNGNEIAENIGYTPGRVSVIRNSPLYKEARESKWTDLQDKVTDKKSTEIVKGDPVELRIKGLAMRAVEQQASLLEGADSDFVRNAVANSLLDRAGYKPYTEKTKISVEVTEKMADRFERVLGRNNGFSEDAGQTKVRVTQTVSQ